MRLTVLGCSGSTPGPHSPASGYLVEANDPQGDVKLLLDLGNGAFGALQRHADPMAIDGVCISHLHPDHCNDLCGFFVSLRYGPGAPDDGRVRVWGPDGTGERMAAAYGLAADENMDAVFDFRAYPGMAFDIGTIAARAVRVNHPVATYAVRIEHGGRSLVYSGDTGPTQALVDLAGDADLMLCEAGHGTREDGAPDVHLTGHEAGELARVAGVKKLIVTHVPPWCDLEATVAAAGAAFGGPVDAAAADRKWEI